MASFTTHATYSEFTLYSYWRSSSSWRVRAMLAAKKVKYDYVDRHLVKGGQFEEPYATSINKMQQVPALTFKSGDKMVTLTQSLAMIKFLEAAFPDINPITPADPIDLALAEEISEIINSGIQPLQNFSVMAYLTKESNETINGKAFGKTQVRKAPVPFVHAAAPFAHTCGRSRRVWLPLKPSSPLDTPTFPPTSPRLTRSASERRPPRLSPTCAWSPSSTTRTGSTWTSTPSAPRL